jgi:hypothetical protein
MGQNIPTDNVEEFWRGLREIIGNQEFKAMKLGNFTPQRDAENLVKSIPVRKPEVRLPMALYVLDNCSIGPAMFRQLTRVLTMLEPEEEPLLVRAMMEHQHSDDITAFEIFDVAKKIKNTEMKATLERLGIDVTKDQLLREVSKIIDRTQLSR